MKMADTISQTSWKVKTSKKRNKIGVAQKEADDEDLAYHLALIASMEESNNQSRTCVEDEPLDVIDSFNAPKGWNCRACTYLNGAADTQCVMCMTQRSL